MFIEVCLGVGFCFAIDLNFFSPEFKSIKIYMYLSLELALKSL